MDVTAHLGPGVMPDWLARRALLSPHQVGLVAGGHSWTFAQWDQAAGLAAAALAARGVGPGQRVALLMRNSHRVAQLVFGLMRLGAVLVPLNVRLAPPELGWQLADSGAALLVHDEALADQALAAVRLAAQAAGSTQPAPAAVSAEALLAPGGGQTAMRDPGGAGPTTWPPGGHDLAAVHCLIYTSGTTGRPKGALLTYGNHWWNAVGAALHLGLCPGDRWLAALPLFHVGGLSILMKAVLYGITAVVHESFDPEAVNRAIEHEGVTLVSAVSAMLTRMLEARGGRPYPPHLRCILLGGGPTPPPLLADCLERGIPVVTTYGLTETASQAATLPLHEALDPRRRQRLATAGKPLFPVTLRIEADGQPLPPGEAGEICVHGPTVMAGYHNRPDATARALREGWLHTGDVGYLDEEGYLYVLDRRDDLIISGGENVYPAEVEAVLLAHPAVAEAGVTAQDHPRWGQVPVAAVRLHPGAQVDEAALLAHCRQHLARYKVPVAIHLLPELPRNASGKLLRRELRRLLAER